MGSPRAEHLTNALKAHLLVVKEELEVLELSASVRDLVRVAVKSLTVLVLRTSLVVSEHTHTVLHGENLVVDTAIVAILVAEIVEALTQLGDQLVLLRGSNLNSTCLNSGKKGRSELA